MDDRRFDFKSAQEWIAMIESSASQQRRREITYPKLLNWIQQIQPESLLDLGAGQGACSTLADSRDFSYTGLEPSEFLLERARELFPEKNKNFIQGSIYQIPLADESFDAALALALWHLLEDLQGAAAELGRVLKKEGHFLIVTANPNAYADWIALYSDPHIRGQKLEGKMKADDASSVDVLYLHSLDEIKKSLHKNALQLDRLEEAGAFIWLYGHKN